MLKKLLIRQFKCFKEETISFGQITVLAGANGVGKSSVIQAMLLLNELYRHDEGGGTYLSINDKTNTFLELGSTKEILYSNAEDSTIIFRAWDEQEQHDTGRFEIIKQNALTIKGAFSQRSVSTAIPLNRYLHYLNAERLGPRNTQNLAAQRELHTGFQGEYTGYAIAEASRLINSVSEARRNTSIKAGVGFDRQVEAWMDFIIPDVEINIETFENINQVRIGIRKKGAGTEFLHPNNIGFGISYVLPIVVSGLIAEPGSLLIVENPEAHLHPLGQSRVGQFLAKMAGAGVQVIVETHSEHIINGIRIAALKQQIPAEKVLINYFSQRSGQPIAVQPISINDKGELEDWPGGFFDQEEKDLSEIFQLSRKSK